MEQAFVIQSAITAMEDEVEAMEDLKSKTGGGRQRVNLKSLVGNSRRR